MNKKYKIVIAGAGGIGSATGLLLRELGDFDTDIFLGDADTNIANKAATWISEDSKKGLVKPFTMPKNETNGIFNSVLSGSDILLDCLPGSQAPRLAKLAKKHNLHYANLTEYIKETEEVKKIAEGMDKGFILQTGLAPGFIDILANGLFNQFCQECDVDKADYLSMKVGALTKNASNPQFYRFTWSSVGVATEYLEPAVVVRDFKKVIRPSLSERANIVVDEVTYEEALTSGGAADLPDRLESKVRNLDYKTLRYPGHYAWIDRLLKNIDANYRTGIPEWEGTRASKLQAKMEEAVPLTQDDIVIIYSFVRGHDKNGNCRIIEKSYRIEPSRVGNKQLRAIQLTTAAGLAESARLLLSGKYKGIILQSQIDPIEFMNGPFISHVYK